MLLLHLSLSTPLFSSIVNACNVAFPCLRDMNHAGFSKSTSSFMKFANTVERIGRIVHFVESHITNGILKYQ